MPCTRAPILGGGYAIICTRGPRRWCACGQRATLQCDAPSQRRSGTCDRHICAACATEVGPDRHLCREHAAEKRQREDHEPSPMEPWQAGLF